MRILCLRSNPRNADLILHHLRQHAPRFVLETVSTHGEAVDRLTQLRAEPCDLVLMDFRLPGVNVPETLREWREVQHLDIPVVLLAEPGDEEAALEAARLGAVSHVVRHPGYLYQLPALLEGACDRAELARVQARLRDHEARFRSVMEHLQVGVLLHGPGGETIVCNRAATRILGLPWEQLVGRTSLGRDDEVIHEDGSPYPGPTQPVQTVLATGRPVHNEVMGVYRWTTMEWRWLVVNALPWLGPDGKVRQVFSTLSDISERRQAEEELRRNAEALRALYDELREQNEDLEGARQRAEEERLRYRELFESAPDGYVVTDAQGTILEVNKAAASLLNLSPFLLLNQRLSNFVPHKDLYTFIQARKRALTAEATAGGEVRIRPHSHPELCIALTVAAICDQADQPVGLRWLLHDITERKRAEEALRESEQRYRNVVESQTELICRFTPDTRLTFVNDAYCRYFDKPREELIGTKFLNFIPPPWREEASRHIESLIDHPRVEIHEHEVLQPGGGIGWQQWVNHAIPDADGKVVEFQGVGRDITERKRAEEALRESEQRYRTIFEKANDAVFLFNERDEIIEVNQRACELLGYAREELLMMRVTDLQAAEVRGRPGTVILGELEKYGGDTFEALARHRSGRRVPIEITNTPISDQGQRLVLSIVRDITERKQLERQKQEQISSIAESETSLHNLGNVIGRSIVMREMIKAARKVAAADVSPILMTGETGTGKSMIARAIHYASPRAQHPFVLIDCTSVPETLFESELFGHEQGAFTDAKKARRGRLELARGGTLFLDEISELPLSLQAKLLQVIQEGTFQRLGGRENLSLGARIIAATNRDLRAEVAARRFRSDLFQRLFVVLLEVPPLRARAGDVVLLVEHFLAVYNRKHGRGVRRIEPAAAEFLERYAWPGNVRELEHAVERAVFFAEGEELTLTHMGLDPELTIEPGRKEEAGMEQVISPASTAEDVVAGDTLDQINSTIIRQAVEQCGGNIAEAARRLGISRSRIYRVLRGR